MKSSIKLACAAATLIGAAFATLETVSAMPIASPAVTGASPLVQDAGWHRGWRRGHHYGWRHGHHGLHRGWYVGRHRGWRHHHW